MKPEVSVAEIADVFKEIQQKPENLFEMICLGSREIPDRNDEDGADPLFWEEGLIAGSPKRSIIVMAPMAGALRSKALEKFMLMFPGIAREGLKRSLYLAASNTRRRLPGI